MFPYSARPGTLAAAMTDQVPLPVREERAAVLRALDICLRRDFIGSQLGRIRPVLLESRAAGQGLLRGHSDNYLAVTLAAPDRLLGRVVDVRLEGPDSGVRGRLVADSRKRHEKGWSSKTSEKAARDHNG
ncbi:MAG: hypothetical protein BWK76_11300 [Desulfobulbaceae bacterium A2]|nr:MAG: hypothetical protein BWK76_11300 [Desulfobulbaceae bacterium A2]